MKEADLLEATSRQATEKALRLAKGNVSEAARLLNRSRIAIYERIKRWKLRLEDYR